MCMDAHVAGVQCPYVVNPSHRDNTHNPLIERFAFVDFLTFNSPSDLRKPKLCFMKCQYGFNLDSKCLKLKIP